jgi:hypothetical protein
MPPARALLRKARHRLRHLVIAAAMLVVATLSVVTVAAEWAAPPPAAPPRPAHLAIVGASIVDPRDGGRVLADHTIVVAGRRIVQVAPARDATVPEGAQVVDGRDRFVIPGLWDAHIHTLRLSPQLHLPLLVAYGVTAVRDMGDACSWTEALDCIPSAPAGRTAIDEGPLVGPRIVEAVGFHVESMPDSLPDTVALVTSLARRGEPFVKAQLDLTAPAADFARLQQAAASVGLPLAGHLPVAVDLDDPGLRLRSLEHDTSLLPQCSSTRHAFDGRPSSITSLLRGLDDRRCDAVLARLAAHRTAYVPTHVASSGQDARFATGASAPDDVLPLIVAPHRWVWAVARRSGRLDDDEAAAADAFHRAALALTARAHRAGVVVLAGTDALDPDVAHGPALHDELAALVRAGLTPADALDAATAAPAGHAGLLDERGTIEAGKIADLVVLRANPLEDIMHTRTIEAVVAEGRVFDAGRRGTLLEGVRRAAGSWATAARLVRGLWWDRP